MALAGQTDQFFEKCRGKEWLRLATNKSPDMRDYKCSGVLFCVPVLPPRVADQTPQFPPISAKNTGQTDRGNLWERQKKKKKEGLVCEVEQARLWNYP